MSARSTCRGPGHGRDARVTSAPSRREFLWRSGGGLGGIALASLLAGENLIAAGGSPRSSGLHHPPKAKRVIQLFMNGGVSQMDTFLHRPRLAELHGKPFDPGAGVKV